MLRLTFIGIIVLVGTFYAVISPFYALLFYLWNAYFRPDDWIWWVDVSSWHISLIVGVFVLFRTLISAPTPRFNLGAGLLLLFLVQAVIGTIASEHVAVSAAFLTDFVKVIVISYLIVVLVTDRDKFRMTLVVIALSLGLEAAKQGWANLFLAPGMPNGNTISFLGDNNGVAVGLMMLVPILSALARTATRRWEKYAFQFINIGVFLRALTTYSRGGFLAAAVLGVFLIGRAEKKLRAVLAIGAIVALVFTVMPQEYLGSHQHDYGAGRTAGRICARSDSLLGRRGHHGEGPAADGRRVGRLRGVLRDLRSQRPVRRGSRHAQHLVRRAGGLGCARPRPTRCQPGVRDRLLPAGGAARQVGFDEAGICGSTPTR